MSERSTVLLNNIEMIHFNLGGKVKLLGQKGKERILTSM
jgi:hypothetical protein